MLKTLEGILDRYIYIYVFFPELDILDWENHGSLHEFPQTNPMKHGVVTDLQSKILGERPYNPQIERDIFAYGGPF